MILVSDGTAEPRATCNDSPTLTRPSAVLQLFFVRTPRPLLTSPTLPVEGVNVSSWAPLVDTWQRELLMDWVLTTAPFTSQVTVPPLPMRCRRSWPAPATTDGACWAVASGDAPTSTPAPTSIPAAMTTPRPFRPMPRMASSLFPLAPLSGSRATRQLCPLR